MAKPVAEKQQIIKWWMFYHELIENSAKVKQIALWIIVNRVVFFMLSGLELHIS